MLDNFDKKLLEILVEEQAYITGTALAILMNKNPRTVQNRLHRLSLIMPSSAGVIKVKKGQGYLLEKHDADLFDEFMNQATEEQVIDQIIQILVNAKDYVKASYLIDNLYISKSKLTSVLNDLRKILENYNLEIKVKPHYGMKICGDEFNYRRFISSNYVQKNRNLACNYKHSEEYDLMYHIISKSFEDNSYFIPEYLLCSLTKHILIAVKRVKDGQVINCITKSFNVDVHLEKIINQVMSLIEDNYHILINEDEKLYLYMIFSSKQELCNDDSHKVPSEINSLVDKILVKIKEEKFIDLLDDFDLRIMLALHLVPLKARLENNMILENPIISDVRKECAIGYEVALSAASVINNEWHSNLSEDEISYIALHLDVAIKKDHKAKKKNILVVCSSGRASSELLRYNFEKNFKEYINKMDVCDIRQVDDYLAKNQVDYIFTTIPLEIYTTIPVLEFNYFLNDVNVKQIKNVLSDEIKRRDVLNYFDKDLFFEIDAKDKEEALNLMIDKVISCKEVDDDYRESIWKRESIFTTDILNFVALPHPSKVSTNSTFVALGLLNKPVFWGRVDIQLIVLVNIGRNQVSDLTYFYDSIIKLFDSDYVIQRLLKKRSYETFVEELMNLELEINY